MVRRVRVVLCLQREGIGLAIGVATAAHEAAVQEDSSGREWTTKPPTAYREKPRTNLDFWIKQSVWIKQSDRGRP